MDCSFHCQIRSSTTQISTQLTHITCISFSRSCLTCLKDERSSLVGHSYLRPCGRLSSGVDGSCSARWGVPTVWPRYGVDVRRTFERMTNLFQHLFAASDFEYTVTTISGCLPKSAIYALCPLMLRGLSGVTTMHCELKTVHDVTVTAQLVTSCPAHSHILERLRGKSVSNNAHALKTWLSNTRNAKNTKDARKLLLTAMKGPVELNEMSMW